jgi:putative MATE family efflux protein
LRAGKARNPDARRYDREILYLALPALGALAAEPTYVLVDTAIVGHLGTPQLAALAIAATLLSTGITLFNFLTYGTTAQVARLHGAGEEAAAGRLGAQALWLAVGLGGALFAVALLLAPPAVALMGGRGEVGEMAVTYLRISALGLPFAMIALAGQGFLRGIGNLRRPLVILVAANAANVVLEVLFVYGFGWGIVGSAWGTVLAQAGMGAAFVYELLRVPAGAGGASESRRPRWGTMRPLLKIGGDIAVRTGALLLSFALASAVVARMGDVPLAAHQVAFQLFIFLALVLDAIAIAGQIMVGRSLGAGDAQGAYAAAVRMIFWSVAVGALFAAGLLAGAGIIPRAFTGDPAVIEQASALWPLFVLMQPIGAAVFALDGILIGASDTRFLKWSMVAALAVFAPLALAALSLDLGVVGVWIALNVLMAVRLFTCGARFVGRRWAVVGV